MSKIGVLAGSYKPYHAGHDSLVRIASRENDIVHLFVSLADRKRPGEVPIHGSDMQKIWIELIEPSLPENVIVHYTNTPIKGAYELMGAANEEGSLDDTYYVYGDDTDVTASFPVNSLKKYMGNLYGAGKIILRPFKRTETANFSGTKLRRAIQDGDFESFNRGMPSGIDVKKAWNILTSKI